jgi:hypothetical protein
MIFIYCQQPVVLSPVDSTCLTQIHSIDELPNGLDSFIKIILANSSCSKVENAPFEALCGRKCRTPLMWSKVGERSLFGPNMIKDAEEQVAKVRENLKVAQSRQKSYADTRRRPLEFQPGDFVYLKVSPIRVTRRFQVRGKLAP